MDWLMDGRKYRRERRERKREILKVNGLNGEKTTNHSSFPHNFHPPAAPPRSLSALLPPSN